MKKTNLKDPIKTRSWYEYINNKNEKVLVEINRSKLASDDLISKAFKKYNGTQPKSTIFVNLYVTLENGNVVNKYNPTIKRIITPPARTGEKESVRHIHNMEWMLEVTEENELKILNEIKRLSEV